MEALFGILFGLARLILFVVLELVVEPASWSIPDTRKTRVVLASVIVCIAGFICWGLFFA